jgi:hypothetical protein
MKSLGRKPEGERLERLKASPRWAGERFHNVHPVIPGLRDVNASMPTVSEFHCDGLMPRLGEPVEPAHAPKVAPGWRDVDTVAPKPGPETPAATLPKAMPWPID